MKYQKYKNLVNHIRATKGNINTKFFSENKLPFELFLRLSQISNNNLLKYADDLELRISEKDC